MHAVAKVTIVTSILFAILATFFFTKTADDASPAGAQTYLSVLSVNAAESKQANADALTKAARESGLTLVKLTADPHDVTHGRILYVFPSTSTASYKSHFEHFSAATRTTILSSDKIAATDLRGLYFTSSGYAATADLTALLDKAGIVTRWDQSNPTSFAASKIFASGGFISALVAALMALVLGLFYSVTFAAKATAVKYLNGYSPTTVTLSTLGTVSRTYWLSALAAGSMTLAGLAVYNGLSLAGVFFLHLFAVLAGLYVLVALILLASFAYQAEVPILAVIKGRRPVLSLGIISGLIQVVMVIALLGGVVGTASSLHSYQADAAQSENWVKASDAVTLRFSPNFDEARFQQVKSKIGKLIRSEDQSGNAIVSVHQTDPDKSFRPDTGNFILVNNEYLAAQNVVDDAGKRISSVKSGPGSATILIPESARSQTAQIRRIYSRFFQFQQSEMPGAPRSISIAVRYLASPVKAFNYGGTFMLNATSQVNPVIVVVPATSELISDDYYASVASTGNILFTNYSALKQDIKALGLTGDILSIDRASDAALADLSKRRADIALSEAALAADLIVFALASLLLASVYCEANKQQLFAKYMSGQRFAQKHGAYLAAVTLGVAVVAVFSTIHADASPPLAIALCVSTALASLTISGLAVAVYEKTFRGDAVKRY
jgi:hypothetical protein